MRRAQRSRVHLDSNPDAGKGGSVIDGVGIALTQVGKCRKPRCCAPLFAELLTPEAPGRCIDCAPPFVEQQEKYYSLYIKSGGRLPPFYGRDPSTL